MDKFLKIINFSLNQYLNLDPDSKQRLDRLNEKNICIELLPMHFVFYCHFSRTKIKVTQQAPAQIHTTIQGTPLQLLGVAIMKENRHQFFAEDVSITGDAELGQQVIHLFDAMSLDWEDYLAYFVGDVPAYHTTKLFKKVTAWIKQSCTTLTENMNEFLHEEANMFPPREALQDFFNEIDELRMTVDRISQKVNQLAAKMTEAKE